MDRKKALITGGCKGIGFAIAKSLAAKGYDLLLTYRSDTFTAQKSCDEINKEFDIEAVALKADSADANSLDIVANHIAAGDFKLDVTIFNAGMTCRDSFEAMKMTDWQDVFFANVHFPVFLLQRLLTDGLLNSGGSVVFTGSLTAIYPHAMSLSYGVSKAAVHALVKNMVKFLMPYNIRVNAVAPGFVDTDWQKNKSAEIRHSIESKIALGRFCNPNEITDIYNLLIDNQYLNGEIIVADGGYSFR
ncbi:MAG: SDR family oxidoreductase [Tannerella sp.]|jgi:3-oxoacyl-[acyl-carrier protein] reductase|nr:SDR family oxidoreductase [Tannerella sp.]